MTYDDPKPSDPNLPPAPAAPAPSNAPPDYKTAGIFTLASGIVNILASLSWIGVLIWICIGVLWVVPLAAGIFEIIVGISAMNGQPAPHLKTASILGLVAGVFTGNPISIVLEILSLVWMNKPEVSGWMASNRA